jgi:hypothetical protein
MTEWTDLVVRSLRRGKGDSVAWANGGARSLEGLDTRKRSGRRRRIPWTVVQ